MAERAWRVWQDGEWTILHCEGGGAQTTISLNNEEATALAAEITRRALAEQSPVEGGWIEWKGGECPVAADDVIDIQMRDGRGILTWTSPEMLIWAHLGKRGDIIAYRLALPMGTKNKGLVADLRKAERLALLGEAPLSPALFADAATLITTQGEELTLLRVFLDDIRLGLTWNSSEVQCYHHIRNIVEAFNRRAALALSVEGKGT